MSKRILSALLCAVLLICLLPTAVFAEGKSEDIVILYENDVHCAVEGYSALAAMKKELQQTHEHVGVVSSGDFIQGASLGVVSRGEYIIRLQNLVGYDAIALGNHEFDYHLPRLDELVAMMETKPVCCNFERIGENEPYYDPYTLVSYGETQIAYVGLTTPTTVTSSSPAQFKDENGEFIYTFRPTDLYTVLQENVDAARAEGADIVIVLSHLGDQEATYDVHDLITETSGIDVVLDGHSHSVIEGKTVENAQGEEVLLSSTGTKFAYIGKLTISEDGFSSELISTEEYGKTDPILDACIAEIYEEYEVMGNRKVGTALYDLITHDADGNRLVRLQETNLGDLLADAVRTVMEADIAYFYGGGIRAPIEKGDITFNDLLNVLPFNNRTVMIEVTGQTVIDMLEMSLRSWPEENSIFPHVAGLCFSVDTSIPSSVVVDENGEFCGVDGYYRVYNVRVLNRESGEYEPIVRQKTYSLASNNYLLLECGDGMSMLRGATVLRDDGILDVEVLERYITEHLGGEVGEEYAEARPNATFTEGGQYIPEPSGLEDKGFFLTALIVMGVVCFAFLLFLIIRANRTPKKKPTPKQD